MVKKFILLVSTVLGISGAAQAQFCGTDQVNNYYKKLYPQIEVQEKALNEQIKNYLMNMTSGNSQMKTTAFGPNDTLRIPLVVHIVHDYGNTDYISDQTVYNTVNEINSVYMKQNTDLSQVIAPFQQYIGMAKINFFLATKDPAGNPTNGITRRVSYLTKLGNDQAKFDQWDPGSYINIWVINDIEGDAAAYAITPSTAAQIPHRDGIISQAGDFSSPKIIAHELAHILNINHTWGQTNQPGVSCGDDDVDDTPPTEGELGGCSLYDTVCNNTYVPTSKILIDSSRRVADAIDGAGIDFDVYTGISLKQVSIYPTEIGAPYNITLLKKNGNNYDTVTNSTSPYAQFANIGNVTVDSSVTTSSASGTAAGITFNALTDILIESVVIYPTATNTPYKIYMVNGTDTLDSVAGVTTVQGLVPQKVNLGFYAPQKNNYNIYLVTNPGLYIDSANGEGNVLTGNSNIAFTNYTTSGRYNYMYDWRIRTRGFTTATGNNNKEPMAVFLDYTLYPGSYRLVLTDNSGLSHDSVGTTAYNKNIPCVIDIKNETTNGMYNYMYNWVIRYGYIKKVGNDCIDYPDTVNTQNIMNYANCKHMFSKGQVERMRAALASDVARRNNLITLENAIKTGIYNPATGVYGAKPALPPIADFSVEKNLAGDRIVYVCADGSTAFKFKDRSWRGTISGIGWQFPAGANATSNGVAGETVNMTTTTPGWQTIKLTANNAEGSNEVTATPVYAADPNFKLNPMAGYFQEFNADGDRDKWPIFNHYNNAPKWEVINGNGFFDKTCIMYKGYDERLGASTFIGSPGGDIDDFYSPAFDLSGVGPEASLNFMYAGCYRATDPSKIRDTFEIFYSTDCGQGWQLLKRYHKGELATKGTYNLPFAPLWHGDWAQKSIDLPSNIVGNSRVLFRFRYQPGADDATGMGTGNNFYLDRINISPFPAGVNTIMADDKDVIVAPNPTHNGSYVVIKNSTGKAAQVVVTDITGKVVYTVEQALNGKYSRIEIPASAIAAKGVYMVQIVTGDKKYTEKLVAY